ncbi:MAG: GntR family transcriptional regulator [Nocardioidaceae bacterium]
MNALDPDDPRPPYQQVANALRAAILTRTYPPGDKLPSQNELAETYGVARMTIQQALRTLREEGLIVSRQGSGVFVRERTARPVGLRPLIESAFEANEVRIDFAGYTSETLSGMLHEPLDKIRIGRLRPDSIDIRILLADMAQPQALPSRAGDQPGDDPAVRRRMARIAERYTVGIQDAVNELGELGLVQKVNVSTRVFGSTPVFKLYLINSRDLFFGFYPVLEHEVKLDDGTQVPIFDPMGKNAALFHHVVDSDPESMSSQYVAEAARWYNSVWTTVAHEYRP